MHLVEVATDLGFKADQVGYVVIGFDLEEVGLGLEAIEDAVEEVPAPGVAVNGGDLGGFEEGFGGAGLGVGRTGGWGFEVEGEGEGSGNSRVLEIEFLGAVAFAEGFAGGDAPDFEVGFEEEVLHECWIGCKWSHSSAVRLSMNGARLLRGRGKSRSSLGMAN